MRRRGGWRGFGCLFGLLLLVGFLGLVSLASHLVGGILAAGGPAGALLRFAALAVAIMVIVGLVTAGRAIRRSGAVLDERVLERDERVEDDRPPERRDLGRRQVEVSGVADDQRVESAGRADQRKLRDGHLGAGPEARGPVLAAVPDRDVPLDDLDSRPAQACDRERVPRVVPLIRPEVQDSHARAAL
jgi:hypothetical protein